MKIRDKKEPSTYFYSLIHKSILNIQKFRLHHIEKNLNTNN